MFELVVWHSIVVFVSSLKRDFFPNFSKFYLLMVNFAQELFDNEIIS